MNGINGYQVYQNSYAYGAGGARAYENRAEETQTKEASGKGGVEMAKKAEPVALSEGAQKVLDRIREKYGANTDVFVANYDSDEEAQGIMAAGTKEYSLLLSPDILEKMAADKDTESKYMGMIDEATGKLSEIQKQLGKDGAEVTKIGVSLGEDGNMKFYAELEKMSEKQKERIEKRRSEKKEEAKKAEKAEEERKREEQIRGYEGMSEPPKRTRVSAQSADELMEKIKNVDWNSIQAEPGKTGGLFNFSV